MSYKQNAPNYTEEQLATAIDMAHRGESITKIIEALCTYSQGFWRYKEQYPKFKSEFERARQEGLEVVADKLLTLADEEQDVQRARLKSDNFKWLLSKRKPQVYGDKLDVNINQTVDISIALSEARARAKLLPPREVVEIPSTLMTELIPIDENDE